MKKWITASLAAGLLAICPSALLADSSTNSSPNTGSLTTTKPDAPKKGEQRRQIMAILGITKAELKGLAAEDKTAKLKEAAHKKIAELEAKQTASSLTETEQSNLALLKKFEKHGHKKS
jgi:hypothetical protein